MSETRPDRVRRRRSGKAFAAPFAGGGEASRIDRKEKLLLGLFPALIYLSHLGFGANHVVASQWLTLILSLALAVSLASRTARQDLAKVGPIWPVVLLFGLVLLVAGWSVSSWSAAYANPIWAWADLPGLVSVNRSATLLEIGKLLGLACAFVIGCIQGARGGRARATFEGLMALGAAYAAIALLTFLSGAQVMAGGRLSGGFLSANSGATVFGTLTLLALANLVRRWRQTGHSVFIQQLGDVPIPLAYLLLFATCLILTASRMGVSATVIAAGVFLLWDLIGNTGRRLPVLIGGGVLVLAGVLLLVRGNDLLWLRFDALDTDLTVRTAIFKAHWSAFLASPQFGYGLGTFNDVNSQIMTADNYRELWTIRAAHNVYIQWLEEAGIIGAAPMFLLIAVLIVVAAWRTIPAGANQTLQRGLVAANLVVLIHSTTDYALQTPSIAAFWAFLLGLQFAFGQTRGNQARSRKAG